jgi:uncharacterized protein
MSDFAEPVAERSRIQSIDVVRGFALLGILAVNAAYFAAPFQAVVNPALSPLAVTPGTMWTWRLMHLVFELKMVTLFSMLFGVSIYLVGAETDDAQRGAILRRRLAWLFVFGFCHGALIWYGDILLTYAVTGLGVMFLRSLSPHRLFVNGIILFGFAVALVAAASAVMPIDPAEAERLRAANWAPPADAIARIVAGFGGDSFEANLQTWWLFTASPFSLIFMARTAAMMLIGLALYKWGFFSGAWPTWRYATLTIVGAASLAFVAWQAQLNIEARFDFVHMSRVGQAANTLLSPVIAVGYASMLILILRRGMLRPITDALAAVGRMALTNYIAQSLIMTTIFYGGRGLGLFGQADRVTLWAIVLSVWALQIAWSTLWLRPFQLGPLEWLWRRLSYARPMKLRR